MSAPPGRLASALADHYRLERELGAGGMATVWLAHDLKHERLVAVKVLRPELSALLGAERFLFATDYPHDDPGGRMKFEDVELLRKHPDISEEDKELIRWKNAVRLFHLES